MDTESTTKSKHSSAYSDLFEQYPHQSSNGRREFRVAERGSDNDSASFHSHSASVDNSLRVAHANHAKSRSRDHINKSAAQDFEYAGERRVSLPSQVAAPEFEQPSNSPIVSDIDDRYSDSHDVSFRGPSDGAPSRARYDFSNRSQEDLAPNPRSDSRSRSQPSGDKQRQSSKSRRPPVSIRRPSGSGPHYSTPGTPVTESEHWGSGDRSSAESLMSQETTATSVAALPALQTKGPDNSDVQFLEPVLEDDPRSWDLVDPVDESGGPTGMYALEKRSEQMFSSEHLRTIFNDPKLLLKFTGFLNTHRPRSIAILIYYLDALKALRAINYANAIAEALDPIRGQDFTRNVAAPTRNPALEEKADRAFEILSAEDLPAFIAHTWTQVVSISIQRRITGTLAPHLREASEGLAEVFCLTDPSRADNPIVFVSEEFVRTTQYGMNYVVGRNCRFLQGPKTNPLSVKRLKAATKAGREHTEVFVNYRRDGSPFMNLLMTAPLMDSRGNTRYFIGAQVDVSNLVKECSDLEALTRMVEKEREPEAAAEEEEANKKDEFQELSEMFNGAELETVRKFGGRMHKDYVDNDDLESVNQGKRRLLLRDTTQEVLEKHGGGNMNSHMPPSVKERINGKLGGVYQHYLLIRPAPSLRILFTSPSLRVPGILQSPFLNRIGGSSRVRSDLRAALGEGRGVTAKIRWLTRADEDGEGEGRPRWIHCTPLFGHSGAVGVWMIVLVDEEGSNLNGNGRRFRPAPPVSAHIGGKDWEGRPTGQRRQLNTYDTDTERGGGLRPPDRPPHSHLSRNNTAERPASAISAGGKTPGDVSEFSFQLK